MDAKDIQAVLAKKKRLEQELKEINDALSIFERHVGPKSDTPRLPLSDVERPPSAKRTMSQEEFDRIAKEILTEATAPLRRSQLLKAFEAKGHPITGDHPNKNIGTKLWRARNWIVHHDTGYWLKERETPRYRLKSDVNKTEAQA
jgi:hypothetical protein